MAHPLDTIHRVNIPGKQPYLYYPVAIIGAGESGICLGARLQQVLGFNQFRIFDRRSGLGGTWHSNTYPGIACDVPAILYSFSFAQNPNWTGALPPGKEILDYMYNVSGRFGLLDKIQCDTNVKSVKWIEKDEEWELVLEVLAPGVGEMSSAERKQFESEHGIESTVLRAEMIRAKVVASAAGGLVEPKPNLQVPGIESFKGRIVHSARWDDNIDVKDKNVVVVGTGCSAAQVVPQLVKPEFGPAKHVTQLLRSPPWAVPHLNEEGKKTFRYWTSILSRIPGCQDLMRKTVAGLFEWEWYTLFSPTEAARARRKERAKVLVAYMKKKVPEEYHEILTPNYELFCKRRVIDDGWYESFQDPRIDISSQPLTGAGPDTVTLGPGRYYPPESDTTSKAPTEQRSIPCDVLVLANGYQTNEWLHPLDVQGRNGKSLHEVWKTRGGAQAYLGLAMDGFPNFFMIFGPNTATGHTSVIMASENMVNYSLKMIKPILNGDVKTVEVKESAERAWTAQVQKDLKNSVYQSGGCVNWYADRQSGWNSSVYPYSQIDFTLRCIFPRWSHWDFRYSLKGLVKLWLTRLVRFAIYISLITGVVWWRRVGNQGVKTKYKDLTDLAKEKAIGYALKFFQ